MDTQAHEQNLAAATAATVDPWSEPELEPVEGDGDAGDDAAAAVPIEFAESAVHENSTTSVMVMSQEGSLADGPLTVGAPPLPMPEVTGVRSAAGSVLFSPMPTHAPRVRPQPLAPLRAILCLSSAPLVPTKLPPLPRHDRASTPASSSSSSSSHPPSASSVADGSVLQLPVVAPMDSKAVLTALARWQQQDIAHAAMLVAPREGHDCASLSSDPSLRLASGRGAALPPGYGLGTVGWVSPITRDAARREAEKRQGLGLGSGRDAAAGKSRRPSARRARSSRAIYEAWA